MKSAYAVVFHTAVSVSAFLTSEAVFGFNSGLGYPLAPTIAFSSSSPDLSVEDVGSPGPDEESTTTKPSSPRFIGGGLNENLIPIYCSTLAAVLIGLLAYIVFKRWNSCKQNKQAANNRAATANQTSPSPEGEKLHSDSGISVDSQSLQEQQQLQTQAEAHTQTQTQLHTPEQIAPNHFSPSLLHGPERLYVYLVSLLEVKETTDVRKEHTHAHMSRNEPPDSHMSNGRTQAEL
ncbi:tumor necrosis factor receptor superfamily member 16 [Tachysurus ichikawai]